MGGEWIFTVKDPSEFDFDLEGYQEGLRRLKERVETQGEIFSDEDDIIWATSEENAAETNVYATFRYSCGRTRHTFHGTTGPEWKLFWDPSSVPSDQRASDTHARCNSLSYRFLKECVRIQLKLCKTFPTVFELYLEDGLSGYEQEFTIDTAQNIGMEFFQKNSIANRNIGRASHSYNYDTHEDYVGDNGGDDEEEEFTPTSGYYFTGNGDCVYAFQGESRDLQACDKECGYCGRCQY
jgi:hypothetical protein